MEYKRSVYKSEIDAVESEVKIARKKIDARS